LFWAIEKWLPLLGLNGWTPWPSSWDTSVLLEHGLGATLLDDGFSPQSQQFGQLMARMNFYCNTEAI
jgi:hypothetical protein